MIEIPDVEYEKYNAIRNVLFEFIPFAIINSEYLPDRKKAFFTFFDSDYIPESLRKLAKNPPGNSKLVEQLENALQNAVFNQLDKS
jgi:hypothetical protein